MPNIIPLLLFALFPLSSHCQKSGQCLPTNGRNPHRFHAPARDVPPPRVDNNLKRQFLLLFHREGSPDHKHNDPHDTMGQNSQDMQIDKRIIDEVNRFCPRDTLFYSFSPMHFNATMILQQQFMAQRTAADVLRLAKNLLTQHMVNPRVWYYGLLGATIMRPDLSGYQLAWASDATPDMYVPFSLIQQAVAGSSRPFPRPTTSECRTSLGTTTIDKRLPITKNSTSNKNSPRGRNSRGRPRRSYSYKKKFVVVKYGKVNIPGYGGSRPGGGRRPSGTGRNPVPGRKPGSGSRGQCLPYKGTQGATASAENRLWYFREDIQLTQHHWYWHQYFPQTAVRHPDRRGENFYYSHHNIIARYNTERLANGLERLTPINFKLGESLGSGYNSDLVDTSSGRFWTPRAANTPLSNLQHLEDPDFGLAVTVREMSELHATLLSHVGMGYLLVNRSMGAGQLHRHNIRNPSGLGGLANTVEAAEELSLNADLYHSYGIHNLGHVAVALATDPDYRCRRPTGVMADLTVTFRDPAFYKVHLMADEIFDHYKRTLPPYQLNSGEWPLVWKGVAIESVEVILPQHRPPRRNVIETFWSIRRFPLEEGIDGSIHEGDVDAEICHQHLNHEPFRFRVVIDVNSCEHKRNNLKGTVRIFMAPVLDVDGRRFEMSKIRKLMFQLDAFTVDLKQGRNVITRNSYDSSSTKPWTRALKDMLRDPNNGGKSEYCGCGWPSHLYMPKGTVKGMQFHLFVMVTNFEEDKVTDTPEDLRIQEPCRSAYLFCGVPYRKYPDRRPMGYPFDRNMYSINTGRGNRTVTTLEEYTANVPNMKAATIVVKHVDTVKSGPILG